MGGPFPRESGCSSSRGWASVARGSLYRCPGCSLALSGAGTRPLSFWQASYRKMLGSCRCGDRQDPRGPPRSLHSCPPPLPGASGGEAAKAGVLFSFAALFLVWEMPVAPFLICAPGSTVSEWVSQCPPGNSLCVINSLRKHRVYPQGLRGSGELGSGRGHWGGKKTPTQGCHARRSHDATPPLGGRAASSHQGSGELGPHPSLQQSWKWGLNPVRGAPRLPARLELNTGGLTGQGTQLLGPPSRDREPQASGHSTPLSGFLDRPSLPLRPDSSSENPFICKGS